MRRNCILLLLATAGLLTAAEAPRYHFGDDPRWSDPNLDDSSWSVTNSGKWAMPPFDSSGIMWVRFRVPVGADYSGPLAISSSRRLGTSFPNEIWVNGVRAGGERTFPPHPSLGLAPATPVFDLAPGIAVPGQTAQVALRIWYPPVTVGRAQPTGVRFEIGSRELLHSQESDFIAQDHLSHWFDVLENLAYLALGATLLIVWRLARGSRDVFWFACYLLAWNFLGTWQLIPALFRPDWPYPAWDVGNYLLIWCGFATLFEFLWSVYELGRRWVMYLLSAAIGVVCIMLVILDTATELSRGVFASFTIWATIFFAVNVVLAAMSAWQFWRSPAVRGVAAAVVIWSGNLALTQGNAWGQAIPHSFHIGTAVVSSEDVATNLFIVAVGYMLLRRLWDSWRRTRELNAEFEAARQMQQSLVPPATGAAGFAVASVYMPSKEVGGDFFWTVPAADGSLLLVAGDVSGKGLKAAMTVATLAGALRNEPSRQPALVLSRLNAVLLGHEATGFTTCCAALFDCLGHVTIANAGHVPPYRNGEELEIDSGLPLGLIADPVYSEVVVTLGPGDGLTFVSDGVLEARNGDRELYGFDRLRTLSRQSATQIAETARAFGQEDDISVVTIQRRTATAHAA